MRFPCECPHFLDEPVVEFFGPLTREESNDFVSPADELRAVPPSRIDRVGKRHFLRVASVPAVFGEAHLLNRTLTRERRQGWAAGRRCCCHDFFSLHCSKWMFQIISAS